MPHSVHVLRLQVKSAASMKPLRALLVALAVLLDSTNRKEDRQAVPMPNLASTYLTMEFQPPTPLAVHQAVPTTNWHKLLAWTALPATLLGLLGRRPAHKHRLASTWLPMQRRLHKNVRLENTKTKRIKSIVKNVRKARTLAKRHALHCQTASHVVPARTTISWASQQCLHASNVAPVRLLLSFFLVL